MTDPNVPSYFLIILCGFGVVWGYRRIVKSKIHIHEFEYVAFSTLWGSLIFLPILYFLEQRPLLLTALSVYPFIATPTLFLIGIFVGTTAGFIKNKINHKNS